MEKRLILAIAFSILIIVTFQYLSPKPPVLPSGTMPAAAGAVNIATIQKDIEPVKSSMPPVDEKVSTIETEKLIVTFSNIGGSIKAVSLKDYRDLKTHEPLKLVDISDPKEYVLAFSSITPKIDLVNIEYIESRKNNAIVYSAKIGDIEVTKEYNIHNSNYNIDLQVFIKNNSGRSQDICYRLVAGSGIIEKHEQDKRLIEVSSKIDGKPVRFKRAKPGETVINPGSVDWAALKSKYFSIILKPLSQMRGEFYTQLITGDMVTGVESDMLTISPSTLVENKFVLFAGPSHIPVLKEAGYDFEETLNYGFFGGISKALLSILRMLHNVVRSWGVAIILLSIVLNAVTLPLTMKSFKSMQKMQELHPQMEKLKIEHKDNPQKLNKEIMELYKKYKINPLSGCLPMLLQMPIFVALYQALTKSLELRSANFLWIKDLSSPDAVPLPFTLPLIGDSVNILPLIMVGAMVLQQKISTKSMGGAVTEEQKQQQKMMLVIMPIMFGFIFYNMPSGLVLYWVINTSLTIVEQGAILKKA
ncbi:MAG: membrane protein insertase YidC [Candidatus Omnitrophica bacterium]|nr:membrane protein insertase YidC [Candidatus Omnitrophota bacterium]